MKLLILIVLIAIASVKDADSFLHGPDLIQKCVPDSKFIYDNNFCQCDSDGTEIVCQRDVYSSVTPLFHRKQLQNLTAECVPNRIFKLPCQECICDEMGKHATCVRSNCAESERVFDNPKQCIPGSVFNVDCNGCLCGDDGKAVCTRLGCTPEEMKMPQCVPNSSFQFECNSCFCTPSGESSCNKMGCTPFEFWHEHVLNVTMSCQPKSLFDYNCHECVCGDDGSYAMCNGKSCSGSSYDKTKDTKERCNPGMIFGDDCNVCVCGDNGKGVCTTFSCDTTYHFKYSKH